MGAFVGKGVLGGTGHLIARDLGKVLYARGVNRGVRCSVEVVVERPHEYFGPECPIVIHAGIEREQEMALPRLRERIPRKGSREIQALLLLAAQIRYGALDSDGFQCLAHHALGSRCVTSPQVDCILSAGDKGRQGGSAHVNVPHLDRSKVNGRRSLKTLESFARGNELG